MKLLPFLTAFVITSCAAICVNCVQYNSITAAAVTRAPVHVRSCPAEHRLNPLWLTLHPECREFTA